MEAARATFPSPTGVNYYECEGINNNTHIFGFRPQQGLTIMNWSDFLRTDVHKISSFRPQQGLTIMNIVVMFIILT